jgi:BASS family bile acid:Na+ symporter
MNAARWIGIGLNLSIVLMVFSLALRASGGSARAAFSSPSLLLRSLLAMFVIMPALAVSIALSFDLNPPLLVALMLLALAPVPPVLPAKQLRAGGDSGYVLGLLVVSALAAVVVVPAGVEAIDWIFHRDFDLPWSATARVVATSVLLPVIAGLALARLAPSLADRIAGPVSSASSALLLLLFVPVVVSSGDQMLAQLGNFTIVAIIAFIATGLAVGHLLGGPRPEDRTSLALATATRHPGVAIAVLNAVAPEQREVAPVLLLYLLVGMVVSVPYLKWRSRAGRDPESPGR